MNNNTKRFVAITGIGLALMTPINRALGDENSAFFAKLSAEWLQWALSIPTSVNKKAGQPMGRYTGQNAEYFPIFRVPEYSELSVAI
jgi:hypothetical protein